MPRPPKRTLLRLVYDCAASVFKRNFLLTDKPITETMEVGPRAVWRRSEPVFYCTHIITICGSYCRRVYLFVYTSNRLLVWEFQFVFVFRSTTLLPFYFCVLFTQKWCLRTMKGYRIRGYTASSTCTHIVHFVSHLEFRTPVVKFDTYT